MALGPLGPPGWGPSGSVLRVVLAGARSCTTRAPTTSPARRRLLNLFLTAGLMPKQCTLLGGPPGRGAETLVLVDVRWLEVVILRSVCSPAACPHPQVFINLQFCCFADRAELWRVGGGCCSPVLGKQERHLLFREGARPGRAGMNQGAKSR